MFEWIIKIYRPGLGKEAFTPQYNCTWQLLPLLAYCCFYRHTTATSGILMLLLAYYLLMAYYCSNGKLLQILTCLPLLEDATHTLRSVPTSEGHHFFQRRRGVCDSSHLNADWFSKKPIRPHLKNGPALFALVSKSKSNYRKWTKDNVWDQTNYSHSWKYDNNNRQIRSWRQKKSQKWARRWQIWRSSPDHRDQRPNHLNLCPAHIIRPAVSDLQRSRFFKTDSKDPDFANFRRGGDILPAGGQKGKQCAYASLCSPPLIFYLQKLLWLIRMGYVDIYWHRILLKSSKQYNCTCS